MGLKVSWWADFCCINSSHGVRQEELGTLLYKLLTGNEKPWGEGGADCLKGFRCDCMFVGFLPATYDEGGVPSGQLAGEVEWEEAEHRSQDGVWRRCLSSRHLWLTTGSDVREHKCSLHHHPFVFPTTPYTHICLCCLCCGCYGVREFAGLQARKK